MIGVKFAGCGDADMWAANDGRIYIQTNYSVDGDSAEHVFVAQGGIVAVDPPGQPIKMTLGANVTKENWIVTKQGGMTYLPGIMDTVNNAQTAALTSTKSLPH